MPDDGKLTFRGRRGGALDLLGRDRVTIATPHGTSAVPGPDMAIYDEMAGAIQMLEDLARDMNRLDSVDPETREVIRDCRLLAVKLRGEIERRIR